MDFKFYKGLLWAAVLSLPLWVIIIGCSLYFFDKV